MGLTTPIALLPAKCAINRSNHRQHISKRPACHYSWRWHFLCHSRYNLESAHCSMVLSTDYKTRKNQLEGLNATIIKPIRSSLTPLYHVLESFRFFFHLFLTSIHTVWHRHVFYTMIDSKCSFKNEYEICFIKQTSGQE